MKSQAAIGKVGINLKDQTDSDVIYKSAPNSPV